MKIKTFLTAAVFIISLGSAAAQFAPYDTIIYTMTSGPNSVRTGDFDGDGDLDVVAASVYMDQVAWYENLGGGTFGKQHVIPFIAGIPLSVDTGDFDGDQDLDVVYVGQSGNISWFANDGTGNFSLEHALGWINGGKQVVAGDVDSDGDLDIVAGGRYFTITGDVSWFENTGGGNFGPAQNLSSVFLTTSVFVSDLNNDGKKDIVACSDFDSRIFWCRNLGSGNFTAPIVIDSTFSGPIYVFAADIDNDGDSDLVVSSNQWADMACFKNDGSGNFTNSQTIPTGWNDMRSVYVLDLDNDGDKDIAASLYEADKIVWYANNGTGTFGTENIISTKALGPTSVTVGDIDANGTPDVLSTSWTDCKISWYANSGTGSFGNQNVITTSVNHIQSIELKDINNDGNKDLFTSTANDNKIAWYLGDSLGNFSNQIVVDEQRDGVSGRLFDYDGDQDPDIVVASVTDSTIRVYSNGGNGNFAGSSVPFINGLVTNISFGDLNGDSLADIIGAVSTAKKIVWFANNGAGNFGTAQLIDDSTGYYNIYENAMFIADLDYDGAKDIAIASYGDSTLAWYKNNGTGTAWQKNIVFDTIPAVTGIVGGDLNGDTYPDLFTTSSQTFSSGWYANNGSGLFSSAQQLNPACNAVAINDIDMDGDNDLLAAGNGFNAFLLWENNGAGNFTDQPFSNIHIFPNFAFADDLDHDGDKDVIFATLTGIYRIKNLTISGIAGTDQGNEFILYPNPSAGTFTIKLNTPARDITLEISNLLGEIVYTSTFTIDAKKEISLQNISPGIYFVKIAANQKQFSKKIIFVDEK